MSSTTRQAQHGRSLLVLVDMDGVLCDFEGHFLKLFRDLYPDDPFIPLESRNTFYLDEQYGEMDEQLKVTTGAVIIMIIEYMVNPNTTVVNKQKTCDYRAYNVDRSSLLGI